MKSYVVSLLLIFIIQKNYAQYYYKDIISNRQSMALWKSYLKEKIKFVSIKSYEANGQISEIFFGEQRVKTATHELVTITQSDSSNFSIFTSVYDELGFLIETTDSLTENITHQYFTYTDGKLTEIKSISYESDGTNRMEEIHKWVYNVNGVIEKMEKYKNGQKSADVIFKADEKGNIIDERLMGGNIEQEPVYYYYDSLNRLTDIVRYNTRVKRLLPEYIFTYDAQDRVFEMTTVQLQRNKSNYQIWRYLYDERGLKQKELLFNNQKQLIGKIEYVYR